MGKPNAECDACMCQDFVLYGAVSLPGGAPASGAAVYLLSKTPKLLTQTDSSGRFRVPGLCPDGKSILKITKTKFVPIHLTVPKTRLKAATIRAEFVRAGTEVLWGRSGEEGWTFKYKDSSTQSWLPSFPRVKQKNPQVPTSSGSPSPTHYLPSLLFSPLLLQSPPPSLSHSITVTKASYLFLNYIGAHLPQGLCTCYILCLGYSSPR